MRDKLTGYVSECWVDIVVVVVVTVLGAWLRFYLIGQVPPGFNSDEAVGAVGAARTVRQGVDLFYSGQGGSGSLAFYIAAIGFLLFGPSVTTIRGTAAFAGVVGVFATYFATREIFRGVGSIDLNRARVIAAIGTLGFATSFWAVTVSRVAFAGVGVPLFQSPANYFLWRGLNGGKRRGFTSAAFILSGVCLAALPYIYLSGGFAPFVFALFFLLQWGAVLIFRDEEPPLIKKHFVSLAWCAGVAFVLVIPLAYFYFAYPDLATERANQALFTNPLINKGDPWGTLWRSVWGNMAAFGLPVARIGGYPPYSPILPRAFSYLFVLGFLVGLWRIRRPPYLFTLLWWFVMLLPSILSPDSIPHTVRAVGAAPAAYVLVAIGVLWLFEAAAYVASKAAGRDAARYAAYGGASLLVLWALWGGAREMLTAYRYYFFEWPLTTAAKDAYHIYAVRLAEDLNRIGADAPDANFLILRDTAAGDVNPNYTVMFLYEGQASYTWLVDDERTVADTLTEAAAGKDTFYLVRWKASKHTGADPKDCIPYYLEKHGHYVGRQKFEHYDIDEYSLDAADIDFHDPPPEPAGVDFGGQIRLAAFAYGDAGTGADVNARSGVPGDYVWARLSFELEAPSDAPLKASVQVHDVEGHVVGQVDKLLLDNVLHRPTTEWEQGSVQDAYFLVPIAPATPPGGGYRVLLALYFDTGDSGGGGLERLAPSYSDGGYENHESMYPLGALTVRPALQPPDPDELGIGARVDSSPVPGMTLLGYGASFGESVGPGEELSVALFWRADSDVDVDYSVVLLLDGEPISAPRGMPAASWREGEILRGWVSGSIPPDAESGGHALEAALLDGAGKIAGRALLREVTVEGWERSFEPPSDMTAESGADFGGVARLLGYRLEGGELTLYWQALARSEVGYTVFMHVLDDGGALRAQSDRVPGGGAYPTTGWLEGEIIADVYTADMLTGTPPGTYDLAVGMYNPQTGERLPVIGGSGEVLSDNVLFPGALVVQ